MDYTSMESTPVPLRVHAGDTPADILGFAIEAWHGGAEVALATLIEIRGGAARALGSHVAIAADGRFCGYVSGGCVEAAVAAEALKAIAARTDRIVMFGEGSPYFDIVLPCGGGISVAIHVLRDVSPLEHVLDRLSVRRAAGLTYSHQRCSLGAIASPASSGWSDGDFVSAYRPPVRVAVSGGGPEADMLARIASASGWTVSSFEAVDVDTIDPFTAVVLLHHDLDREQEILHGALRSSAFYIGALGSMRTHHRREAGLLERGWSIADIERIKAPIGIFGPAKDASTLALSILADIAATRLGTLG